MNKKYFSKALCYADRAHYFSILIITSLFFVFSSLINLTSGPKSIPRLLDIHLLSTPIILINSIIIFFSYTAKKSKQFYMTTQPYSRDAMIITKLISFSLSFIIPVVIYGVIILLLYLTGTAGITDIMNHSINSPMLTLWKNIFIISIGFTSMVSGIQFLQVLFGKCKYAFLIPFVFAVFIIPITGTLIVLYLTGVSSAFGNYLWGISKSIAQCILSYGDYILENQAWGLINDTLHIVIFTPLTIFLNRRVKSEKAGDIFIFKPIEIICKILLAAFIGFCAISLLSAISLLIYAKFTSNSIDIDIPDTITRIICILILIAGSGLSVLSYKIINKIQARRA